MRRKVWITRCAQIEDLFWEFEHYKKEQPDGSKSCLAVIGSV